MKNYILCRGDSYSMIATSTVVYVDKTMMPTILKNYEAQVRNEYYIFFFNLKIYMKYFIFLLSSYQERQQNLSFCPPI